MPKDPKRAVEWWHKSAAQGNALAQAHLGYSYANGNGVPKDSVLAYAWFNLAAASGIESAIKNRGIVEGGLSKIEFEEAQRLSSTFGPMPQADSTTRSAAKVGAGDTAR